MTVEDNYRRIAEAAIARDRAERVVSLLGGIIEDWAGDPPEQYDNAERLRHVAGSLNDMMLRVHSLLVSVEGNKE